MKGRDVHSWKGYLAISMVMAALFVLATGLVSVAQAPERVPLDPDSVNNDDGTYEVGTEWIAYFTQCPANDIPCEQPQCMGFYDELAAAGWGGGDSFHWGNCSAWADDFKSSTAGGAENNWVDDVDILLFCDHGTTAWDSFWGHNLSALHFGCKDPDADCNVTPGEAYLSYGDNDLEWLGFKACSVLSDNGPAPYYNRGYWAATMNGLHQILGFKNGSNCRDNFGEKWAEYMLGIKWPLWPYFWLRPPYKVTQAWFEAVDDTQPGGVCARVLAEESYFFNDYLWGKGYVYPDYRDGDYTYWDHCACTPPPQPLRAEDLAQIEELPIFEVKPRDVTKDYALGIASAFGMEGEIQEDNNYFYMVQHSEPYTLTLQVDRMTGSYKYRNATKLWATPEEPPRLPPEQEALALAESFFREYAQILPAAGPDYRNGETLFWYEEQVFTAKAPGDAVARVEVTEVVTPTNAALSYGRLLYIPQYEVWLSMVGPGARTKMYLGEGGEILGVQGGSREVGEVGVVKILSADDMWDRFMQDPGIALLPPPGVYQDIIRQGEPALAYFEQPYSELQTELIPTWVFSTTMTLGSDARQAQTQGTYIYVPAAEEYFPPEVSILSPAGGEIFGPGELVTLSGEVNYGREPYTFEWYSSAQGFLGTGPTLDVPLWPALVKGDLTSHTITLQVTDANGQQGSDSVEVTVKADIYLPVVLRNH